MKMIVLNAWGGRLTNPLFDFFRRQAESDIFLLQEVMHQATEKTILDRGEISNLFTEVADLLPGHQAYFAPVEAGEWGLAGFVKKDIKTLEDGEVFVYRHRDAMIGQDASTLGRSLQYFKIEQSGRPLTVLNFHGIWTGQGKGDTEGRLLQSRNIIEFVKTLSGDIILAGDFNLRPETQSLKMLEQELGLKNLITAHQIISTRTALYTKPEKFCDYVLVSPGIHVKDFRVLPDEVSDHAPLFLEFSLGDN